MENHRPHHRTVDRVTSILETVATEPRGLGLTQLALRLGAPVSSIQKLVNGLVATGYLDEHDHRFVLGPALYVLSLRTGQAPVRSVRHADLVELHRATDTAAVLAVRVGDAAVYVDWAGTDDPFNYLAVRRLRTPLSETAVGRVLLAHLPEPDRHDHVAGRLPADPATAVALLHDLDDIRERGYTLGDSGPLLRCVSSVAAPVVENGKVVAAVALAGGHRRIDSRLDDLAAVLLEATGRWRRRRPRP